MRISTAQRTENENRIRTAMDRLPPGEIPPGGKCDVKILARESGIDRTELTHFKAQAPPRIAAQLDEIIRLCQDIQRQPTSADYRSQPPASPATPPSRSQPCRCPAPSQNTSPGPSVPTPAASAPSKWPASSSSAPDGCTATTSPASSARSPWQPARPPSWPRSTGRPSSPAAAPGNFHAAPAKDACWTSLPAWPATARSSSGTPFPGLDNRSVQILVRAVLHASGQRQVPVTMTPGNAVAPRHGRC